MGICNLYRTGWMYGLQLNWNKLEVLPVRCEARVNTLNGDLMVSKESLVYVGIFRVTMAVLGLS